MLDFIESRFAAIGLQGDLSRFTVERSKQTPELARVVDDVLILADGVVPKDELLAAVSRALGYAKSATFTDELAQQWQLALIPASQTRAKAVQHHLVGSISFEDALSKMELPVTKLLAVHLFNGLIAGGMSFENAKAVDLFHWGATALVANGERSFSLLPLLGAYAPMAIFSIYAEALADLVTNGLRSVTHTDVRAEFSGLIVDLFNA